MDVHASPGPDGFGPSFYRHFWPTIKQDILELFSDFHSGSLLLDGLNRAHLVLLPKKEGARSADSFRPISLQNCPMKLFSKVLVNRLKPAILSIIDPDQTGFVHGRSIAENFIYAADLLSCCHKRKVPTAVLKLDFRKAFDSVCWESLDTILAARGFDQKWRLWISHILSTGKTSVLLNGVPGRWINCRRGLRQGDPLSPYLFIIVADVLQRLIREASALGQLVHPIDPSLPCPVLQYADDTLILTRGDVDSMRTLRSILGDFSLATGLDINFHKSTFIPMNVSASTASEMAAALGCSTSSFPQTYLGLPLSPHKLRVSDFQPLIDSFDKYLAGWKARLLSTGGRLVLVNAVLGSLPVYYMSSILIPKTVCEILDARRRAFLWTGEEKCHGSSCLLAWERVCRSKENGGLGIKNVQDQNHCLLMKIVHKLHEPNTLPWKRWFFSHSSLDDLGGHDLSYLSKLIASELPRYRALTSVRVGNGRHTSFWHDKWLLNTTIAETFPALFSHCTHPNLTVQAAFHAPFGQFLHPRLTRAAAEEKTLLFDCLQHFSPTEEPDVRSLSLLPRAVFSSSSAYHVSHLNDPPDPDAYRCWNTKLPSKVRFFGWLLHHGRLNTRSNLLHRNIRKPDEAGCESCPGTLETDDHIFISCPRAQEVWRRLGVSVVGGMQRAPWVLGCELQLPHSVQVDVILLLLWQLWKARNALIFEKINTSPVEVLVKTVKDMDFWRCRFRNFASDFNRWHSFVLSCL